MITLDINDTWTVRYTETRELLATGTLESENGRLVGVEEVVEQARRIAKDRKEIFHVTQFGGYSVVIREDYSGRKLQPPKTKSVSVEADPSSWIVRR